MMRSELFFGRVCFVGWASFHLLTCSLALSMNVQNTNTNSKLERVLFCSKRSALVEAHLCHAYHVTRAEDQTEARRLWSLHPETHFTSILVDDENWETGKLLRWCVQKRLVPLRLVWSSSRSPNDLETYYRCGADAVVNSVQGIQEAIQLFKDGGREGNHNDDGTQSDLGVVARRWRRQARWIELANGALTHRSQQLHSHSRRLEDQYTAIGLNGRSNHALDDNRQKKTESIRIVHISDTHNYHRYIPLPRGDLLIHTGDLCGNYRAPHTTSVVDQFRDFLSWLEERAVQRFDRIVFMAGNHDTYLDPVKNPTLSKHVRETLLEPFLTKHRNVRYLCQSGTRYRGLHLYATPTTICRVESANKHMLSNAFERTNKDRFSDWQRIPPNVDILLTHMPPAGIGLSQHIEHTCPMLTSAVYCGQQANGKDDGGRQQLRRAPRLHAFGHIHSQFGLSRHESTILSNASQERLIRTDLYGGATPIVIDLPL